MIPEENIQIYRPLGSKTFFMLVFIKSGLFFMLLLILIAGIFFLNYIPYAYLSIGVSVALVYVAVLLLIAIIIFGIAWLQYIHYGITVDERNLKITKGLISEETTGIPYRHIKDVKIERSLINQIFGVSDIIITTSGDEDNESQESTTFLPVIEKETALHIQDLILKKAQVEQIDVLSGHENILKRME